MADRNARDSSVTQINPIAQSGSDGSRTVINPLNAETSGGTTQINTSISQGTMINTSLQEDTFTSVNPALKYYGVSVPMGTELCGKYKVERVLSTGTGEAVLYICTCKGREYVAKVYRRAAAIKPDIVEVLKQLDSPYVARLYDSGTWQGMPFEIIPYYTNGSLQGKQYSFDELRNRVIPCLNDGLKVLHQSGIIHKDLKPSNIMICDDKRTVAIIDFGISSIRDNGQTVVLTKTGMTPDYSAPETFKNLFLEESDYYSLGITIYELFCGHTPYQGVDPETLEKYVAIQRIPFPNGFPERLKQLILGLTYNDITNRKDKANPNRRWTYDEVDRWCKGEDVPVPGMGAGGAATKTAPADKSQKIPSITFMYKKYTDLAQLVDALSHDWKNGKKRLYRSTLSDYFRKFDSDLANACLDAEEIVRVHPDRENVEYFRTLYRLYPELPCFSWDTHYYPDIQNFGQSILKSVGMQEGDALALIREMVANKLFSIRESVVHRNNQNIIRQISAIEDRHNTAWRSHDERMADAQLYLLGYYYSGQHDLITAFGRFTDVKSLTSFLLSKPDMDAYAEELMVHVDSGSDNPIDNEVPSAQFYAWLVVQGKADALQ